MKPKLSYTIWFSQRTGSTLLSKALELTKIAGKPNEWLNYPDDVTLIEHYGVKDYIELQEHLWKLGTSPNGVFGIKTSFREPRFSSIFDVFAGFPGPRVDGKPRASLWKRAFPNCRHVFMTRRNKIKLAVSWWKAIQTEEWHRVNNSVPKEIDLSDAYSFDAINHLYLECAMREAGIQEFFAEAGIIPLSITYEDFILEFEETVRGVLEFLELDASGLIIDPPYFEKLADDISDEWVERFRTERQEGWPNKGW